MRHLLNRSLYFLLLFQGLVVVNLTGCSASRFLASKKQTAQLGVVERNELIQRVTVAGKIVPNRKTIFTAPYNGYIKKIFVKIGESVKKNAPIVTLVQTLYSSSDESYPIRAPFPGTVVQLPKAEGEYVKQSDEKDFIVRIDDVTRLFVDADVPEIDITKMHIGQEVIIKTSAILGRSYKGIIREISLAATQTEGWNSQVSFPIRIEILDKDALIKPGMSTIIDVIAAKRTNALTLRHEFVQKDNDSYFVILANGDRKDIKVGIQDEIRFEILEGLSEGDQVKKTDFYQVWMKNRG